MTAPEARPPRAGATLVLVATFALGMIAGAAILHIARLSLGGPPRGGPPTGQRPPVQHLQRELGLDDAQIDRLDAILDESRRRMRAEADATRDRIREILAPDQRERFDAMRPPPPPGPHSPRGGPRRPRGGRGRPPPPPG